jgi:hypothetical protein
MRYVNIYSRPDAGIHRLSYIEAVRNPCTSAGGFISPHRMSASGVADLIARRLRDTTMTGMASICRRKGRASLMRLSRLTVSVRYEEASKAWMYA